MFLIIDGDALYQFHQNAAVQTCQVLVGLEIFNPRQMFHIQIVQTIPLAVHFCFGLTDSFNLFIKGMAELLVLFLADNAIAHILIKLAAQGLIFLFFLLQYFQMLFHRFQSAFILGNLIDFIQTMFQSTDLLDFSLQCGQHHFFQLTFADKMRGTAQTVVVCDAVQINIFLSVF